MYKANVKIKRSSGRFRHTFSQQLDGTSRQINTARRFDLNNISCILQGQNTYHFQV